MQNKKLSTNKGSTSSVEIRGREIWGWCSFDWANSPYAALIVTFVFPAYFAKAIVQDEVLAQVYWTWTIGCSALLVACVAPIIGRLADRRNAIRPMLIGFSLAAIILCSLLWFVAPGERKIWLVLLVVGLSNVAFEIASFLYNALIPSILPDRKRGALSGLAWGMGYFGGLVALALALVFLINPETPIFGIAKENAENVRATFLLVSLWFFIFSIPFFTLLVLKKRSSKTSSQGMTKGMAKGKPEKAGKMKLMQAGRLSASGRFLLARMLYSDGINTIFAVGGIFAISVHGFSLQDVLVFGVLMNLSAAIGAIVGGLSENRLGALLVVRVSLLAVLLMGIGIIFLPSQSSFWFCALTMGLFFGPIQSSSRVILSRLAPVEQAGLAFGWYALSGKATAFLGPLAVGLATALLHDNRLGLVPVLLFLGVGLLLLKDNSKEKGVASPVAIG